MTRVIAVHEIARSPHASDQVAEFYREAIRAGELLPGEALPAVRAIAIKFGVAHVTAFRAVSKLHSEGWIVRRSGKAPIVAPEQPC